MNPLSSILRLSDRELDELFPVLPFDDGYGPQVDLFEKLKFGAVFPSEKEALISKRAYFRLQTQASMHGLNFSQLACAMLFHPRLLPDDAAARLSVSRDDVLNAGMVSYMNDCYANISVNDLAEIYVHGGVSADLVLERLENIEGQTIHLLCSSPTADQRVLRNATRIRDNYLKEIGTIYSCKRIATSEFAERRLQRAKKHSIPLNEPVVMVNQGLVSLEKALDAVPNVWYREELQKMETKNSTGERCRGREADNPTDNTFPDIPSGQREQ